MRKMLWIISLLLFGQLFAADLSNIALITNNAATTINLHVNSDSRREVFLENYQDNSHRLIIQLNNTALSYDTTKLLILNEQLISTPVKYVEIDKAGNNLNVILGLWDDHILPVVRNQKGNQLSITFNTAVKRQTTVVIDPGHGGKDPGTIGYTGHYEKNVVLPMSKYLRVALQKQGIRTLLTRETDVFPELEDRVEFAEKNRADLFVAIHADAVASKKHLVRGASIYIAPVHSKATARFGEIVLASLANHIPLRSKAPYTHRKFYVIAFTSMPALLIETGYMTHPEEEQLLITSAYQKKVATLIANGILMYLGQQYIVHLVQSGDTLSRISNEYQVNMDVIQRFNSLDTSTVIKIGQLLTIPLSQPTIIYRVKDGDSLSLIAKSYGIGWEKIAELNSISDPSLIKPGQELIIPLI